MPEFHIGDKVCVLYEGRHHPFTVTHVKQADLKSPRFYSEDGQAFYPEDRLDYDLSTEQKEWLERAERRIDALSLAAEEVRGIKAEAQDLNMPQSNIAWLSRELREARWKIEP